MMAIWLLGGSYLAMSAALILVGIWEARQVDKKGNAVKQKITVWCCETCAEVYHIEARLCPTCGEYLRHQTFDTMWQLTAYIGRIEMEQYRHALERRMPGMTITREDALLFHSFEHRNECVLFARCCEAAPVAASPSPADHNRAELRRLQFVTWMRANKGAFNEFPED